VPKNRGLSRRPVVIALVVSVIGLSGAVFALHRASPPTPETIVAGAELFQHEWTVNDPLAGGGDGLGPVSNARSCVECHFQGGVGGAGTNKHNVVSFEVVPVSNRRRVVTGVVHAMAKEGTPLETKEQVHALFPIVPGGVRVISGCSVNVDDFDPVSFEVVNTPALFGVGLIDKISEMAVQANATKRMMGVYAKELRGDFSSTHVGQMQGKFGWKGQFATLKEFVAAACAMELGLTNPYRQQNVARQHVPNRDAELDMTNRQFNQLLAFIENLPAPREVPPADPALRELAAHGKTLFATVGCAQCHTPDVGGVAGVYSDFLLYSLEDDPEISYGQVIQEFKMPAGHPDKDQWKTPPLWGVADSAPYFHDGQSPDLESAIARHRGEARRVHERYKGLTPEERQAVIAFLNTLRAPVVEASPLRLAANEK